MSQFAAKSALPTQYDTYPFIAPSRFTGKLNSKVVLITGASAGLGKASAHAFAAAGASVACVARRETELDKKIIEQISEPNQQKRYFIRETVQPRFIVQYAPGLGSPQS